jgi:ribosomal protein S18 acetylase RimI-like enzyme
MANQAISFRPLSSFDKTQRDRLLVAIKQVEKRTFPPHEAFAFDDELRKRNTTLICATRTSDVGVEVVAYLVYVRAGRTALVHKLCVVEHCRREGVARTMLIRLHGELAHQGCRTVQLWVDSKRLPARHLYSQIGFSEAQRVDDYYGQGRTGLKMVLDLEAP